MLVVFAGGSGGRGLRRVMVRSWGAAGGGVVEDGAGDGGVGKVADVLPAEGEAGSGGWSGGLEWV